MGRSKTISQETYPYNINARCINKEWFRISLSDVWEIFSEELYLTNRIYNLQIHMFLLMSNHFHMIASTPESNISQCMHRLMSNVSRRLNEKGNRINENFAGRHFKTILSKPNYFLNAYKYNYRNPVRAGLCERVEDYPYSTLHGLIGNAYLGIPTLFDDTLFNNFEDTLAWINTPSDREKEEAVKWALKRQFFKSKKNLKDGKYILSEDEII